jgi:peroxiredoxin
LVWFRGTWCPYCRKQLRELSEALPPYRDGVTLVAVSSDTVQEHRTMEEELRIQVTMLSDPGGPLVTMCPVSHCVALVGPDGSIRWSSTSGNWDKLNAEALIQNAYELR